MNEKRPTVPMMLGTFIGVVIGLILLFTLLGLGVRIVEWAWPG